MLALSVWKVGPKGWSGGTDPAKERFIKRRPEPPLALPELPVIKRRPEPPVALPDPPVALPGRPLPEALRNKSSL